MTAVFQDPIFQDEDKAREALEAVRWLTAIENKKQFAKRFLAWRKRRAAASSDDF